MVIINIIVKVRLPQNVKHIHSLSQEALKADNIFISILVQYASWAYCNIIPTCYINMLLASEQCMHGVLFV